MTILNLNNQSFSDPIIRVKSKEDDPKLPVARRFRIPLFGILGTAAFIGWLLLTVVSPSALIWINATHSLTLYSERVLFLISLTLTCFLSVFGARLLSRHNCIPLALVAAALIPWASLETLFSESTTIAYCSWCASGIGSALLLQV